MYIPACHLNAKGFANDLGKYCKNGGHSKIVLLLACSDMDCYGFDHVCLDQLLTSTWWISRRQYSIPFIKNTFLMYSCIYSYIDTLPRIMAQC